MVRDSYVMKLTPVPKECHAKDPSKCRYHGTPNRLPEYSDAIKYAFSLGLQAASTTDPVEQANLRVMMAEAQTKVDATYYGLRNLKQEIEEFEPDPARGRPLSVKQELEERLEKAIAARKSQRGKKKESIGFGAEALDAARKKVTEVDNIGVHVTHCCSKHGCMYHDKNCPVASGAKRQQYTCEFCSFDVDEIKDWEYSEDYVPSQLPTVELENNPTIEVGLEKAKLYKTKHVVRAKQVKAGIAISFRGVTETTNEGDYIVTTESTGESYIARKEILENQLIPTDEEGVFMTVNPYVKAILNPYGRKLTLQHKDGSTQTLGKHDWIMEPIATPDSPLTFEDYQINNPTSFYDNWQVVS